MSETSGKRDVTVKHRDDAYAEKYRTAIWCEESDHENPFIETDAYCSGYSLEELVGNVSYAEMLFLLIKGELPDENQKRLLNKMLVAFSHPGVRNEASRASILAGVGKTVPQNVLPVALLVYGGSRTGAGAVEEMMRFLAKNRRKPARDIASGEQRPPVLGDYYGGVDVMAGKMCDWLLEDDVLTPHLHWSRELAKCVQADNPAIGLTKSAVAAAALCDMGFMPKYGVGLLQLMAAPGLLAQGFEHTNKPATVLPFVSDEDYELKAQ